MAYALNPYLPKVRAIAVRLVRERGWTLRQTARYIGVQAGTVSKWMAKAPVGEGSIVVIPTASSRPHTSPRATDRAIVDRIITLRQERGRCAEVLHAQLLQEGVHLHLSTVKRILAREGLLRKRSPWKHWHQSGVRPIAAYPGDLVEIDSIHLMTAPSTRTYIVTVLDCFSRWAFAWAVMRLTSPAAVGVVGKARTGAPFLFRCIQSDHGPEFSAHFTRRLAVWNIRHRHIRVRQPNDNAHVERFNRTLQEELHDDLRQYRDNPKKLNMALAVYLTYYNTERLHLGLGCKTPLQMFPRS